MKESRAYDCLNIGSKVLIHVHCVDNDSASYAGLKFSDNIKTRRAFPS